MNAISSVSMCAIPYPDRRSSSHAHRSVCTLVVGAPLCVATYGLVLSAGFFNALSRRARIMAIS
jgi:hypothetical protein